MESTQTRMQVPVQSSTLSKRIRQRRDRKRKRIVQVPRNAEFRGSLR